MNGLFGGLFDFNLSNLIGGMDMGVNFDNMTMDQKRQALRGMTKGTMLGGINPELPMPIQLPDAAAQAATGAMDPMMAISALQGLLSNEQPQMLPMVQQQAIPGLSIPMADMNRFYGGLL
tara:strand:- start:3437 stop:3796 length:360 start_codon:yes stop_codon:yes gene_type:complete